MKKSLLILQLVKILENLLPITYSAILPGQDPIPNYLIGDPAYPPNSLISGKNTRTVLLTLKLSSITYYEAQGIKLNVHLKY